MRIVLLADTHGFLDPRIAESVAGADRLVHAGDVGQGIEAELRRLADAVWIVAGNNDPADCPWPQEISLDLPGGQLAIMHGHQWPAKTRDRKLRAYFPEAAAIVCGHSHRRVLDTDTTPWLINPGAAGKTRAYGGPSYVELMAKASGWQAQAVVFEPLSRRPRSTA